MNTLSVRRTAFLLLLLVTIAAGACAKKKPPIARPIPPPPAGSDDDHAAARAASAVRGADERSAGAGCRRLDRRGLDRRHQPQFAAQAGVL